MSFILESIKQAERERKLGQQHAPEISIEYTGVHVDDIKNNNMHWLVILIALVIAAVIVWTVAFYLTNKDSQYYEQLSVNKTSVDESIEVKPKDQKPMQVLAQKKHQSLSAPSSKTTSQNHVVGSANQLHTSDLKSIKLITEENEQIVTSNTQSKNKQFSDEQKVKSSDHNKDAQILNLVAMAKLEPDVSSIIEDQSQLVSSGVEATASKQQLVKIYTDLATIEDEVKTTNDSKLLSMSSESPQLQIKTANFVAPEKNASTTEIKEIEKFSSNSSYKIQHAQAVSSGVPSFGELPYDIQEQIPDFNVSVHMFHADPLRRRIRINGQMYTEGKSLQQDFELVEITRYGAVFDYQGKLFRFNVR